MSVNVKLSKALVERARSCGAVQHRSVPEQIEHWVRLGKLVEENPDLPFSLIRDILIADQEAPSGTYRFTSQGTAG